ncbi:MAG: trypsin-like peptidase domain-containing protein [Pseudomonadota bacterium]
MIVSQALAVLGSLLVLFLITSNELPSGVSPHSAVHRDEAPQKNGERDDRRIVDARLSPYSAIGKFRGSMTCTAAIVLNPRIIITAGHCVTERDGTTRRSNLSFQPGYQTGSDLKRYQATIWAVGSRQSFARESVREASRDWAILILDRAPAGVHPFLLNHHSLKALVSLERQIFLPAYSNDIGHAELLSVDPACTVRGLVWNALIHTCLAQPGSSGAPLLLRDGPGYVIIGIHTGSMFASDNAGQVGRFIGNRAIASWMFSEAAFTLSRHLDGAAVQTVNAEITDLNRAERIWLPTRK